MADCMNFPATVEEFMEQYKITDTEQVYTNGAELIPIFRMKQWFDRHPPADVVQPCRCKDCIHNNDCDIQHSAQAGDNFFCGFGETEKDVREDVYE